MTSLTWPGDHRAGALLGDESLVEAMVAVEQAWLDALVAMGAAPAGADLSAVRVDVEALAVGAEAGGNPVIGLVEVLRAGVPAEVAAWIHRGLTSQDVLDTALVTCARAAVGEVRAHARAQVEVLAALAERHRDDPALARTLTQPAAPSTLGLRFAGWLHAVLDAEEQLAALRWPVQLGGAAGTLAALFIKEVAGSDHHFRLDEFADTMRSRMVSVFSEALAESKIPALDIATRYSELGEALLPLINGALSSKYGLELTSFIVENVSVPPDVEAAIDKRSSMAAVGNLNDYVKFQMAQGMASGNGGAGGTAAELAVGFGIAQQMMKEGFASPTPPAPPTPPTPPTPSLLSPADVAARLGVPEADVMAILESGELKAKKIGASYRVTQAALDAYLAQ